MVHSHIWGDYKITPVDTEKEVNYVISTIDGYVCRLVPGQYGFELSSTDKALGIEISHKLLSSLSDFIVQHDA